MNDETSNGTIGTEEGRELLDRRLFLQSMGKWSAAAIAAAVCGGTWLALPLTQTPAGSIAGAVTVVGGSTDLVVGVEAGSMAAVEAGMDQPSRLWGRWRMGQPLVGISTGDLP